MNICLCIICPLHEQIYECQVRYITSAPCIQATLISKALSDKGEGEKEGLINSIMGATEEIKHWDGS